MQKVRNIEHGTQKRSFRAYPVLLSSAIAFSGLGCATLAKLLPWIGGGTYAPSTAQISSSSTAINVASNSGNPIVNNGNGSVTQNNYNIGAMNITVVPIHSGASTPSVNNSDDAAAPVISPNPQTHPANTVQSQANPPAAQNGKCSLKDGPRLDCGMGYSREASEEDIISVEKLHFSFDLTNGMTVLRILSPDCNEKSRAGIPFNQQAEFELTDKTKYIIVPGIISILDSKSTITFSIAHVCQ